MIIPHGIHKTILMLVTLSCLAGLYGWARMVASERARLRAMASPERMEELNRALELNPASARAREQRFMERLKAGQFIPAREDAEKVAPFRDSVDFALRRAYLEERLGHTSESLRLLEKARAMQPDSPMVLTQLTALLYGHGRMEEARVVAEDLYLREPKNLDALFILGAVAQSRDQADAAVFYYRQMLDGLRRGEKLSLQIDLPALQDYVTAHEQAPATAPSDGS